MFQLIARRAPGDLLARPFNRPGSPIR